MSNAPFNVWSNMVGALHPDLAWLVANQAEIVKVWPARAMPKERPVKVWPNGFVRIEFVHTWPNFGEAREECERRVKSRLAAAIKEIPHAK